MTTRPLRGGAATDASFGVNWTQGRPSAPRVMTSNLPVKRFAPDFSARSRNHSSNSARSTMPTYPPSIGMSTLTPFGDTIVAQLTRALIRFEGMSKSRMRRGGIAPPHGLMRPARSSSATLRPRPARSLAAVAPAGPPPITITSKISSWVMAWTRLLRLRRERRLAGRRQTLMRRAMGARAGERRSEQEERPLGGENEGISVKRSRAEGCARSPRGRWRRRRRAHRRWPARRPRGPCGSLRAKRRPRPQGPSSSRSPPPR